ncbi:hypothetical protein BDV95DRAFT_89420 [Massariosphaeria phaeospora]|uniref:C2H2-type domain-containing protein n=1 Tax=Massariosphaeria phaeospora TaxID=100035 RepID=A0A7C8M6F2_9PLEO|nr:hypothetical protein BDV95DRAFT_89420 [Massariosphaeria phaeospora]
MLHSMSFSPPQWSLPQIPNALRPSRNKRLNDRGRFELDTLEAGAEVGHRSELSGDCSPLSIPNGAFAYELLTQNDKPFELSASATLASSEATEVLQDMTIQYTWQGSTPQPVLLRDNDLNPETLQMTQNDLFDQADASRDWHGTPFSSQATNGPVPGYTPLPSLDRSIFASGTYDRQTGMHSWRGGSDAQYDLNGGSSFGCYSTPSSRSSGQSVSTNRGSCSSNENPFQHLWGSSSSPGSSFSQHSTYAAGQPTLEPYPDRPPHREIQRLSASAMSCYNDDPPTYSSPSSTVRRQLWPSEGPPLVDESVNGVLPVENISAEPMETVVVIDTNGLRRTSDSPECPVLECQECHQRFTGVYGRGNLARHRRTKHSLSGSSSLSHRCSACNKMYNRTDALKKHGWEKHGFGLEPRKRPDRRKQAIVHELAATEY